MKLPEKPENPTSTTATTEADNGFSIIYPTGLNEDTESNEITLDMFGRPVVVTEAPTEITTDESGNPVEPSTEIFTDEAGKIIEPATDISTDISVEAVTEVTDDEQPATEVATIPPGYNGNDHNKYDSEGNVIPTLPPDFVLIID